MAELREQRLRIRIAVGKRVVRRQRSRRAVVFGDDLEGLVVREGQILRLEPLQRLADVLRKDVRALRKRLAELDGHGSQIRELGP